MGSESREVLHHQIEELLLNAHFECEAGIDLIEEYFSMRSSLSPIIDLAQNLLQIYPEKREVILKNFSECIVVKNQQEKRSVLGVTKRILSKFGLRAGKSSEILRAERFIEESQEIPKR